MSECSGVCVAGRFILILEDYSELDRLNLDVYKETNMSVTQPSFLPVMSNVKVKIKTRELFKDENHKKMSECSAPASVQLVLWWQCCCGASVQWWCGGGS